MRKLPESACCPPLLGVLGTSLLLCHGPARAADAGAVAAVGKATAANDEFLPPDEAFKVGATAQSPDRIEVIFQVHPGYYLYRGRMKFKAAEGEAATLGAPELPAGEKKVDGLFWRAGGLPPRPDGPIAGVTRRGDGQGEDRGELSGLRRSRPVLSAHHQGL